MSDWYEENIESWIRPAVRLLRDNGFNTTCSCHHDMEIECSYITDGSIMDLDNLLFNEDYRDYTITVVVNRVAGHTFNCITIQFPKPKRPR